MRVDRFDWRFSVTSDASVNAFAYPGGRIFVTRGLLDMATDDEVVAVLGHEVGAAPALAEAARAAAVGPAPADDAALI